MRIKEALLTGVVLLASSPALAQSGGVINVATIGEPPTLDPMVSTADLVGIVTQHFFETLYTFDKDWKVTPLLAASMPEVTDGRKGLHDQAAAGRQVPRRLGHDLRRRGRLSQALDGAGLPRQAGCRQCRQAVEAVDPVDRAHHPEDALCASPGASVVQQLRGCHHAGGEDGESDEGAGRHRSLQAEGAQGGPVYPARPLRRLQAARRRAGNGYGGARKAILDEIRFVPVPDPNTRVEGAVSGQFDYVDSLPVESFDRLKNQQTSKPVMLKPFGWPVFVMNTKQGCDGEQSTRAWPSGWR